jgi:hypothetical protein
MRNLSTLENVVWAMAFIVNACLLLVLVVKQRWREFFLFTSWIAFQVFLTILLFVVYREGSARLYSNIYWLSDILDFGLQLAIVFEMARIVLRPTGTWLSDARSRFLLFGVLGVLIAAVSAFIIQPLAHTSLDAWAIRGSLFTSVLICELVGAMMGAANHLGLQWSTHVMGLGQGLVVWAVAGVIVDGLHDLLGRYQWFNSLEELRGIVWIGAVVYWIVIFWRPRRERPPLSPEMQKYLVDLHERVQYDLSKVNASSSGLRKQ